MIEALLGIIAAELGLLLLGLSYRTVVETLILHETIKHNQTHSPQNYREVTTDELKALLDFKDKEKPKTGSYL